MKFLPTYVFRVLLILLSLSLASAWHFNLTDCKASLPTNNEIVPLGVTDSDGNPTKTAADARGYLYSTCLDVCGQGVDVADFTTVVQQMTLWFLPYLTLLAQVPFFSEDDKTGDIVIALLTIGTPMLALYSLFVSLFNWKWIKSKCNQDLVVDVVDRNSNMAKILPNILGRLQQFPMIVQDTEILASALAIPENREWWRTLRDHLGDRERRLDASGTAQLFLACIVYIFAVIEALAKLGGKPKDHYIMKR